MCMMASLMMSVVPLVAIADEYIDPQSKVVYTFEPGSGKAMVKAGYEEIIYRGEGYELDTGYHPGSPDAAGDVVILDRFTVGTEEYVVTSMGKLAFSANENITSVSIPESVTEIKDMAFSYCTNLIAVQLPEGLTRIAYALFLGCNKLMSVVIPSTVCRIEVSAFAECTSMASITIPDGLIYAGYNAFNDTPWYASMYDEAPDGPFYIGHLLLGYKGDKPTGELVIREGTTCIGYDAFSNCKELTGVTVPPSVAYMDYGAFRNCSGLTVVHITDLAAWCGIEFKDEGLKHSSNPLLYARHLYLDGKKVTDLVIPVGVTRIGEFAFDNCSDLTSVTISDGVTGIGKCAFRKCSNMTSVTIPPSLAIVEGSAFLWCFGLNAVYISDLAAWESISFEDESTSSPLYYGAQLYITEPKYFYYYNGHKIPLTLNENKIVVSIPKEYDEIIERFHANVQTLFMIKDENYDGHVVLRSEYEKLTTQQFWAEDVKSVILTSSYFTENNEEVFSTPYIHVRLKKEQDADLLNSYAEKYKLRIVKQDSFMPLWYILSLTLDSEKSPLECANELYESGDFVASVPDLAEYGILPEPTYRPLVEEGKHWTYDNFMLLWPAMYDHYYYYDLKGDTLIAGHQCLKMYSDNRHNDSAIRYEGALYEVDKKVFCFYPDKEEAVLLYDFDCVVGDTIYVSAGPLIVKDIQTEDNDGITVRRYMLHLASRDEFDESFYWIEGVGATMDFFGMLPKYGNYNSLNACELNGETLFKTIEKDPTEEGYHKMGIEGKRWNYVRYHLEEDGWHEEPYAYVVKGDTVIRRTRYKKLWYQDAKTERFECLLLETGRTVYKNTDLGNNSYESPVLTTFFDFGRDDIGRVYTYEAQNYSGNTNWMVYGVDTIVVNDRQFRRYTCLQKYSEAGETLTTIAYDDEGVWHDIWIEGVGSATCGIEDQHPFFERPEKTPGEYSVFMSCYEDGECIFTAYRPFVEEDKVWMAGSRTGITDNLVKMVEYYYFDGDTIIDGKTCKQMMCQRYVNTDHPDYDVIVRNPLLRNVGAWYEEDKKVYLYDTINNQFNMMYDFSLDANETMLIDNYYQYVIGPKQTGGLKGFKGIYRDIKWYDGGNNSYCTTWLEGVGGIDGPTVNVYYGEENHALFLMSCTVGDEVIYLDDSYEDGATPDWARKKRFDFTHTIKTQPKAPRRSGDAQTVYGEYNELQLGINLNPLADTYQVCITDGTGKSVYEKAIDAAGIVGLNIDISAYERGLYTVTVENSRESFTGEFEVQTTGMETISQGPSAIEHPIYNLQGQRLSSLRKGLNIVNGQKIYVK